MNKIEIDNLKNKYQIWFMIDKEDNELLVQDLTNEDRKGKGLEEVDESDIKGIKSYKLPKEVNALWVEKKILSYIENKTNYKNLSSMFTKLIKDVNFYSTTYGLGTHIALNTEEEIKDKIRPVLDLLDENEIEYNLAYSEGLWVYKILLSKKKENLERINKIGVKNKTQPKMR